MLFNSYTFLLFLTVVLVLSRIRRFPWAVKKAFLLLMSYLFYAAWNPPFVALLWISTLVAGVMWQERVAHCSRSLDPKKMKRVLT